jgi:LCCL domain
MNAVITGYVSIALAALAAAIASEAAPSTTTAQAYEVRDIDWRTSPLDLNLRGFNGERFHFYCPPGKPAPGLVVGTRLYADNSAICAAATHAGALRTLAGGLVTIEICPGSSSYRGSNRHFVTSSAYNDLWGGSFIVWHAASDSCPAPSVSHR